MSDFDVLRIDHNSFDLLTGGICRSSRGLEGMIKSQACTLSWSCGKSQT